MGDPAYSEIKHVRWDGGFVSLNRRWALIGFLLFVFLIEYGGHKLTFTSVKDWYLTLEKPGWTPPSWVFGSVWTILYITIAISGWLVWIKTHPSPDRRLALLVYGFQLIANLFWSYFFFYLNSPMLGLIDISILIVLIAMNIAIFTKLYKLAGLLLVPYFVWTLYALFLNFCIWRLN